MTHVSIRGWLDSLHRLQGSPVPQMDRRLFMYVIKRLSGASALDRISAMTHRELGAVPQLPAHQTMPVARVLEVAASILLSAPQSFSSRLPLPTLDEIEHHLSRARYALPARHAEILDACVRSQLSPKWVALKLGMPESLVRRYHHQARALVRCHPWSP